MSRLNTFVGTWLIFGVEWGSPLGSILTILAFSLVATAALAPTMDCGVAPVLRTTRYAAVMACPGGMARTQARESSSEDPAAKTGLHTRAEKMAVLQRFFKIVTPAWKRKHPAGVQTL